MCGIIASFTASHGEHTPEMILGIIKAFNLLKNRGPDTGSLVVKDTEILGFRRLAIVDPTVNGEQPFYSATSRLLCNGEIYNHEKLKKDYDISCSSDSDCECILHLHDKYGFEHVGVCDPILHLTASLLAHVAVRAFEQIPTKCGISRY